MSVPERASGDPGGGRGCYGFAVRSPLAFVALRSGGSEPLHVAEADPSEQPVTGPEPLLRWTTPDDRTVGAGLFADGDRFSVVFDSGGWFRVDPERASISVSPGGDTLRREERLWGVPAALCFTHRGRLSLHAAAVDLGGRAIVLGGPGRFGKTTLAAAFLGAGHRVLSEDVSCCAVDGDVSVLPGPALLRVRRDVYRSMAFPGTSVVRDDPDRVHLAVDEPLRGTNAPVPVRAVVLLRHGEDGVTVEQAPPEQAIRDLWSLTFRLPTDAARARTFEVVTDLVRRLPVWNLARRLEMASLPELVGLITELCP